MKIFFGDYIYPKDKILGKHLARIIFLLNLEHYIPEILKFLKDEVLPIYNQLLLEYNPSLSGTADLKNLRWSKLNQVNEDCCNSLIPLKDIIYEWSNKFKLSDEWIKDKVLSHLPLWTGFPPEKELSWINNISMEVPIEKPDITFNFPRWNPFLDTWGKFSQRMITFFKTSLDTHKKEMEDLVIKSGAVKNYNRRKIARHMHWLVEYQIRNKSYGQIVREEKNKNYDESAIIKAINNTAGLIGLTLKTKIYSSK